MKDTWGKIIYNYKRCPRERFNTNLRKIPKGREKILGKEKIKLEISLKVFPKTGY